MGKSALTWKWFNDIAPQELKPLAGRMWWSFYESDATFENFVIRALAYVTRRAREDIEKNVRPGEREEQLLAALDREPYLLVLDGLERILIAYARMDAAHLQDGEVESNRNLRKTADPRVGAFLRRLAGIRASRILVSTRLLPADLEDRHTGDLLPGVSAIPLRGLSDDDALDLWRASGVSGSRDALLPLFRAFENHPLVIKALAGEVKSFRPAPGDFEKWRARHRDFDPRKLARVQEAIGHVLEFALRGLSASDQQVLKIVAAFRMPAAYDTLTALLVGKDKLFPNERLLDAALTELEDRGLLGWDRRANRYDLHPIVRGVTWNGLDDAARQGMYTNLHDHFESLPKIDDWHQVNSLQDLTPAIELYSTLIGLGRYEDACVVFRDRISGATLYRLSASRQRAELLEALFPDGLEQLPRLSKPAWQAFTLNALATAYVASGQPGRAAPLVRRHNDVRTKEHDEKNLSAGLINLAYALRLAGDLREAEAAARHALAITCEQSDRFLEATSLFSLGLMLAARGIARESESALRRSLQMFIAQSHTQLEGVVNSYLAQRALWLGQAAEALPLADRAWELAHVERVERDFIRAARLQGAVALQTFEVLRSTPERSGVGETSKVYMVTAEERLHHALTRARAVNYVEEELPALVALAELRRRQGNLEAARELLDDVWEPAERGPYPLLAADAFNVLAQIERDAGNLAAAVETATQAYRLAWCDGDPFAYHWGLVAARAHLRALGTPEPVLPPFDELKFEPMPEVEINPHDEFHVEENET
jgi:tetratricopeptide (TPR) repeat protein